MRSAMAKGASSSCNWFSMRARLAPTVPAIINEIEKVGPTANCRDAPSNA